VPPVAEIVHPAYAAPWVPPAHEVVVMLSGPPAPTAATVTVAVAVVEPEESAADSVYVVVDAGLTDTEPLALVDVNVPGVMERVAAPLLTHLSVVLEPGLMLAGLALNDVMVGAPAPTAATVTVAVAVDEPEESAADSVYVVVDAGLTDTEPLALVDVNVPGVMERVAAPLLAQLSVVLEPEWMLAGLALKDVMVGADPVVGGGLVGLVVLLVPESFGDPPQLARKAHAISKSASVRDAAPAVAHLQLA
jgi:hypothetical protein